MRIFRKLPLLRSPVRRGRELQNRRRMKAEGFVTRKTKFNVSEILARASVFKVFQTGGDI